MIDFAHLPRIWFGEQGPGPQTRYLRRVIESAEAVESVLMELDAETRYHLYVNGQLLGRGPIFHHPHRRPIMEHDLTPRWQKGANVVALIVHTPNIDVHNQCITGNPGLKARIMVHPAGSGAEPTTIATDEHWRITDQTGYIHDTPRRGWALPQLEHFDARKAPVNWTQLDFDDSQWATAQPVDEAAASETQWSKNTLPSLRFAWQNPVKLLHAAKVGSASHLLKADDKPGEFGRFLVEEQHKPLAEGDSVNVAFDAADGSLRIAGLSADMGVAVTLDLGENYTGHVGFTLEAESEGDIDVAWSEAPLADRPEVIRKGASYADRYHARAGQQSWTPFHFSSGQYIMLVVRGFEGSLRFTQTGMLTSEADLNWDAHFESSDDRLNAIWEMCERTMRIGTQEGLMDCPSREQAPYIGDGHPVSRWLAMMTGDTSYWQNLVTEQFGKIGPHGLVQASIFTGNNVSLIDYNLLAVLGVRDYLAYTGDAETVRQVMPWAEKIFEFFDLFRDDDGLIAFDWEQRNEGGWPQGMEPKADFSPWRLNLFIDHPGLGWHNREEPGIDRRGFNAALQAAHIFCAEALGEVAGALADGAIEHEAARRACDTVDQRRKAAREAFYSAEETAFIDGVYEGRQLPQVSQETNAWCVMAGLARDRDEARAALARVLREDDAQLSRSGPYHWFYLYPLLMELGFEREAFEATKERWGQMLDGGASTAWETFLGDYLDSWCHPWSATPIDFLLTQLLGVHVARADGGGAMLKPRPDLLSQASGQVHTPLGLVAIEWRVDEGGEVTLKGDLPEGLKLPLVANNQEAVAEVEGRWTWSGSLELFTGA